MNWQGIFKRMMAMGVLVLNISLIFIWLIQGFAILNFSNMIHSVAPSFFEKKFANALEAVSLETKIGKIKINLSGSVELTDFMVYQGGVKSPLFECKRALITIKPLDIFIGKVTLRNVYIEKGVLYSPASISPSGRPERFITDLRLNLAIQKNVASVGLLACQFLSIPVHNDGPILVPFANSSGKISPEVSNDYYGVIRQVLEIQGLLKKAKGIQCLVKMQPSSSSLFSVGVFTLAKEFKWESAVEAKEIEISSLIDLSNQKNKFNGIRVKTGLFQSTRYKWKGSSLGFRVSSKLLLTKRMKDCPIDFYCTGLEFEDKKIADYCGGELTLKEANLVAGRMELAESREWLGLAGSWNAKEQSGIATIEGCYNPIRAPMTELISGLKDIDFIEFKEAPHFGGQICIGKGIEFKEAAGWVHINNCDVKGVRLIGVYGKLKGSDAGMEVETLYAKSTNGEARICAEFNQQKERYRILAEGELMPSQINNWLDSWWTDIWGNFQFKSPLPYADIEISGNIKNEDAYFVFGKIKARDFLFRDTFTKQCDLKLEAEYLYTKASGIKVETESGKVQGDLLWHYAFGVSGFTRYNYDIKSSVKLKELQAMIGQGKLSLLSDFNCSVAPEIHLQGVHVAHSVNEPAFDQALMTFETKAPLSYQAVGLDSLKFRAQYDTKTTLIQPIDFGFADGKGQASAILFFEDGDKQKLEFNVSLKKAQFDKFLQRIAELKGEKNIAANQTAYNGYFESSFKGQGYLGDIESFTGNGDARVYEANLGKVRLLGFISEILDIPPFNITNLTLNDAQSSFKLEKEQLSFPDLKITGKSARINSFGTYNIKTDAINFTMDIFPTAEMKIPVISQVLFILNPISTFFQVELTNKLSEPKWNLHLTPFGLFKKKAGSIKEPAK